MAPATRAIHANMGMTYPEIPNSETIDARTAQMMMRTARNAMIQEIPRIRSFLRDDAFFTGSRRSEKVRRTKEFIHSPSAANRRGRYDLKFRFGNAVALPEFFPETDFWIVGSRSRRIFPSP